MGNCNGSGSISVDPNTAIGLATPGKQKNGRGKTKKEFLEDETKVDYQISELAISAKVQNQMLIRQHDENYDEVGITADDRQKNDRRKKKELIDQFLAQRYPLDNGFANH